MNDIDLTDSMLRESSIRVRNAMLADYSRYLLYQHIFSSHFEKKMRNLIRRQQVPKFLSFIYGLSAVVAIIIFSSAIWFTTNIEAHADFTQWMRELFHNTVIYHFFGEKHNHSLPDYSFGWLPEGFVQSSVVKDSDFYIIVASDNNNNSFVLEFQFIIGESNTTVTSEGSLSEKEITIHGVPAQFYFDSEENAPSELVWIENNIVFHLSSNLEEEDIIAVAEGITKK